MYSRHTGDVLERRPDLDMQVFESTGAILEQMLLQRGFQSVTLQPVTADGETAPVAAKLALLDAITESILTHHYEYGHAKVFDYAAGDSVDVLADDKTDALLVVYVKGVVPTAGRKFLKGAALAVGALVWSYIHISTNETAVVLVLVDRETGHVLWFNTITESSNATKEGRLQRTIRHAGRDLLRARR